MSNILIGKGNNNMKILKNNKIKILIICLLSVTIVLALSSSDYFRELSNSMRLFNDTYKRVVANYVDQIEVEKFTEIAIKKMVKELDPYTVFMTKEEQEPIEMLTKGKYGGVGIRISVRNDTLTAISPMEGSPAKRCGILPGDQILKVDSISTIGLSVNDAAKKIRGKVGTEVDLTIRRPGVSGETIYTIIRENIKVPVLSYSGMLNEETGYIALTGFSRGAGNETKKVILEMTANEKFQNLILDLRSNPGGLLNEALEVAELFTQPGDTLLFTRGRTKMANQVHIAKHKPILDSDVKVAVLVNQGSASASEIVSGIIQDYDRGVILGMPSFGKGLVQRVFPIDREHSLKITNAKYYIPSGRCIQKPDFINNPELIEDFSSDDTLFFTRNGRQFKDGGGIKPDIEVSREKLPQYVRELWRKNKFYTYAIHYKSEKDELPEYSEISGQILDEFKLFLEEEDFSYKFSKEKKLKELEESILQDSTFQNLTGRFDEFYAVFDSIKSNGFGDNIKFIKEGLRSEFATLSGGLSTRVEASLPDDPVIIKSLEIFSDEEEYDKILNN